MTSKLYSKDAVGDLVLLDTIDEKNILQTLKRRHQQDLIYTYIGTVLISVNPFKEIRGLYSESAIGAYRGRYMYELPPHVYALAEDTYRALMGDREDQCVIISGESGAGKTEASKKIMQYIAAVTGGSSEIERVKEQILKSNPVLEAFGNAKTVRNNNSSRFGKYMEMFFDYKGDPVGGSVINYLLEKSRVVKPAENERSFHIFYQLIHGLSESERKKYHLMPAKDYNYLAKSGCYTVERMNDKEEWELTIDGMRGVNMSDAEISDVIRITSAVLWLGQLEFSQSTKDSASIVDQTPISRVADLIGCDQKQLATAMVSREYSAGAGEAIKTFLNKEQAEYTRDALAKAIYFRLFDWIVAKINTTLQSKQINRKEISTIGVLDIYGFEIFDSNSFEQFCINFVNEKLQQIFIEKTIKSEQEEYQREGIEWTPVKYFNNKIVCELIEKKPMGLMALCDEECLLGKGTDISLLEKMGRHFDKHDHFERVKSKQGQDHEFLVKHYAGDVKYNVEGFLDKNKDLVWKDLLLVGESSTNTIMREMFPRGAAANMGKARPVTAGTHFVKQVNQLMDNLNTCAPHYIRCIKPNDQKRAGLFQDDLNLHQVRYLGLLENVRVRRAGFAFRQTFDRFLRRYKMLSPQTWPTWQGDEMKGCRTILQSVNMAEGPQYQFGKSKVFIRHPVSLFSLEELRERKLHDIVVLIQKMYRSYRTRKYFMELREKSLGLFGRNKPRRRESIRRYYVGDYLGVAQNPDVQKLLHKHGDRNILFADEVDKINKKYKVQRRVLLLSAKAVYNLGTGKYALNRRINIDRINKVSVSQKADNVFVLHVTGEYDYVYAAERKTEFLTALADEYLLLTGNKLDINFTDNIAYLLKNKSTASIVFMDDSTVQKFNLVPNKNKPTELSVFVGPIPVVPTSDWDKYQPVKMTKGLAKPRPGMSYGDSAESKERAARTRGITSVTPSAIASKVPTSPVKLRRTPSPPPAKELWARAIDDFEPGDNRELGFKCGDIIRILAQDPNGWWSGELNGRMGFVPSTYLELVPRPLPARRGSGYERKVPMR